LRVFIMEFMSIRFSCGRVLLPAVLCAGAWAQQYTISTIAGSGGAPGFADGAATTAALLNSPNTVAVDPSGKVYIADPLNHRIRLLSAGNVSTIAGTGTAGSTGDGAAATAALLRDPEGVALDSSGNLYIADTGNHVIRKIDTSGKISTIAGQIGQIGSTGDGGSPTGAFLSYPAAVTVDSAGNIYIADTGNSEIRKVSGTTINCVLGCGSTGGLIDHPQSLAVDAAGTIYVADSGKYRIVKYSGVTFTVLAGSGQLGFSGDGGPGPNAQLNNPQGVAIDTAGYVYLTDSFNGRIRKILLDGTIITIAGNGAIGFSGDGGPATSATLNFPRGLLVDGKGNIYFADTVNAVVRTLTPVAPAISAGGVGSAASGAARLSPGSLASVYGNYFTTLRQSSPIPLQTSLGGVSVTVNGVAAPILFVSPTQINFQVPWATQPGTATITVNDAGGAGNSVNVPVSAAAPGIFVTPAGAAVAQNFPDNSLNATTPIAAGGTLTVYLTGIGPVSPALADGAITPSTGLYQSTTGCTATIAGAAAQVSFAGLTPNYVGLAQVNVQVPGGTKSGLSPLVVTCGGQASTSATVNVK
jgi:uncharacterized protein (TIGR03437 family)